MTAWAGGGFPWATLFINVLGSLALGVVLRALPDSSAAPAMRALLAVGFCGAFTTFSTFGHETVLLLQKGGYAPAAAYVAASVVASVFAVFVGFWIGAQVV